MNLRLIRLPAYSPDFHADEAIWDWVREEVTANTCLETKAKVQDKVNQFLSRMSERAAEVKRRCRTTLQAQADAIANACVLPHPQKAHVDFTLALV